MNVVVTSERPSTEARFLTENRLLIAARHHTGLTRVVIALTVETLALLVTPPGAVRPALVTLLAAGAWGVVYLLRLRHRAGTAIIWCDAAVVAAVGLAQGRLDVPYLVADGAGWVQMVLLTALAIHQWQLPHASTATLVGVAALPIAGFGAGTLLAAAPGPAAVLTGVVWVVWPTIVAVVSAVLFRSLRAAARRADLAVARHLRVRAEVEVAAAGRAAKAEQLAALHDTAAATLLMVGLGQVGDDEPWLRAQAARDLAVLTGGRPPAGAGVAAALRPVAAATGLSVELTQRGVAEPLPAEVEAAVLGAAGEALRNITRHAGVGEAQILVEHTGAGIRLEVRDRGAGFADRASPAAGRGIRHSIVRRMELAGGSATVTSAADGVTVRLWWPR